MDFFIADARKQFLKLWSVRFSLATSLYGAIQTGVAVYDGTSWVTPAIMTAAGVLIAIARVLKQPDLKAVNGYQVQNDDGF